MTLLSPPDARFATPFTVVEGGAGTFSGLISSPNQGEVPSYQFNMPRRLLRVPSASPLNAGMVVRARDGSHFLLGEHGSAINRGAAVFRNFRLFQLTGQFVWHGKGTRIDPTTQLKASDGLTNKGLLWGVYEPSTMEERDRAFRAKFETGRFITNRSVPLNEIVDGKKVTRCDKQLGVYVLTLE